MAHAQTNSNSSTRRSLRLIKAERKSTANTVNQESNLDDDDEVQPTTRQAKYKALEAISITNSKRRAEPDSELNDNFQSKTGDEDLEESSSNNRKRTYSKQNSSSSSSYHSVRHVSNTVNHRKRNKTSNSQIDSTSKKTFKRQRQSSSEEGEGDDRHLSIHSRPKRSSAPILSNRTRSKSNQTKRTESTSDLDQTSESVETGNLCVRRGQDGSDLNTVASEPSNSQTRRSRSNTHHRRSNSHKRPIQYLTTGQSTSGRSSVANNNISGAEGRACNSNSGLGSSSTATTVTHPLQFFNSPAYYQQRGSPPASSSAQSYSGVVPSGAYSSGLVASAASASTLRHSKASVPISTESDTDPEHNIGHLSPTTRDVLNDPTFARAAAAAAAAAAGSPTGAALFHTLSGRVQHLMSRVGGSSMNAINGRLQQYIQGIQSPDPDTKLSTLNELCSLLVMSNEETLPGFQFRALYPPLRECLAENNEIHAEISLTACRALTYLMEALPRSAGQVVEATPIFLSKLRSITSIDIAEQALTALEMISKRHGKQILVADGISACLEYIDFFSITSQNKALSIVSNCCLHITTRQDLNYIRPHLENLSNRLRSDEKKSIEHICQILSRLVENFHRETTILREIGSESLLKTLQNMLVAQPSVLNSSTFVSIIHMLYRFCGYCPTLSVSLVKLNIVETLVTLLVSSNESKNNIKSIPINYKSAALSHSASSHKKNSISSSSSIGNVDLIPRSSQELFEIVSLIGELLPRLPADDPLFEIDKISRRAAPNKRFTEGETFGLVVWHWQDDDGRLRPYSKQDSRIIEQSWQQHEEEVQLMIDARSYLIDFQQFQQINEETNRARFIKRLINNEINPIEFHDESTTSNSGQDARTEILKEKNDFYTNLIQALFPVVYEIFHFSAGPTVKNRSLQTLLRMIYFSPSDLLEESLKQKAISSQIGSMLASTDLKIVVNALQIVEILMRKLPESFSLFFFRDGVVNQIEILAGNVPVSAQNFPASTQNVSGSTQNVPNSTQNFPNSIQNSPNATQNFSSLTQRAESEFFDFKQISNRVETRSHRSRVTLPSPKPMVEPFSNRNRSGRDEFSTNEKTHFQLWIKNQAERFRRNFFSKHFSTSNIGLEIIHRLTESIDMLELDKGAGQNERGLGQIATIIEKTDVSPFEIIHTGLITKFFHFFTDRNPTAQDRNERFKQFLQVFLDFPKNFQQENFKNFIVELYQNRFVAQRSTNNLFSQLIQKIHGCINHLEQFPIRVNDVGGRSSQSSALRLITSHQLKCNLVRHPLCKSLKQWTSGPVKIDPLALVSAIEKYLLLRGIGTNVQDDPSSPIEEEDDDDDTELSNESDGEDFNNILTRSSPMRLEFTINDHVIPHQMTIYQAVRLFSNSTGRTPEIESETDTDDSILGSSVLWSRVHTIHYRQGPSTPSNVVVATTMNSTIGAAFATTSSSRFRRSFPSSSSTSKKSSKSSKRRSLTTQSDDLWNFGQVSSRTSLLNLSLDESISSILTINDLSLNAIFLLRILHGLNLHWYDLYSKTNSLVNEANNVFSLIPRQEFLSVKLSSKVNRQLQDPVVVMMGQIPCWITELARSCSFLFPFETRQMLLYPCAFDRERAMQRLLENSDVLTQQQNPNDQNDRQSIVPRIERKKVQLSRSNIFHEMEKILEHFNSKQFLEVQYENEVGFGLGPTLEAYSLLSNEFQRNGLELWRTDRTFEKEFSQSEFVDNRHGLFPAPLARNGKASSISKIRQKFKFLGKFLGKALMDSRMIDIPFSLVFYKWLLGQENSLNIEDLIHVDKNLYEQLKKFEKIVQRRDEIFPKNSPSDGKTKKSSKAKEEISPIVEQQIDSHENDLLLDGCSIDDLCLVFTLPAFPNIELKKNGKDLSVTLENLDQYVDLVVHWTLVEGVRRQFEAFRDGFNSMFSIEHLKLFYADELQQLFCGHGSTEPWDIKILFEATRCDHGYNVHSRPVKWLFELMSEFNVDEQRAFLQFVTGSPRLPVGGFRMLHPPLTIVRKTAENSNDNTNPDAFLPSVMTCVNYLKLPEYSSKEILKSKLFTAIRDGQYAFLLS